MKRNLFFLCLFTLVVSVQAQFLTYADGNKRLVIEDGKEIVSRYINSVNEPVWFMDSNIYYVDKGVFKKYYNKSIIGNVKKILYTNGLFVILLNDNSLHLYSNELSKCADGIMSISSKGEFVIAKWKEIKKPNLFFSRSLINGKLLFYAMDSSSPYLLKKNLLFSYMLDKKLFFVTYPGGQRCIGRNLPVNKKIIYYFTPPGEKKAVKVIFTVPG